jgi:hypothetical protein
MRTVPSSANGFGTKVHGDNLYRLGRHAGKPAMRCETNKKTLFCLDIPTFVPILSG